MNVLPLANAGTPLMWGGCLLLLGGNYVIGWIESIILRKLTGRDVPIKTLVWANYASMVGGLLILYFLPVQRWLDERPFERGIPALAGTFILAYLLTLLIEGPFYLRALAEPLNAWRRWWVSIAATNLITYAVMTLIVVMVGSVSLLKLRPVPAIELELPTGWVYYLPTPDTVRRVRLDGTMDQPVDTLQPFRAKGLSEALFLEPAPDGNGNWLRLYQYAYPTKLLLAKRIPGRLPKPGRYGYEPRSFYQPAPSFRSEMSKVHAGYWAVVGVRVNGRRYALETPLVSLLARTATELPDGKVVVNVGNAIVVIDPEREVAGQIASGRSPTVVLDP